MSRLSITYRKNPRYEEGHPEQPRLFATLDLSCYGVPTQVTDLPIYFRRLEKPIGAIREVYSTRIAGLPVEKGNLQSLMTVLDRYIRALIRFERLPEYMFHVGTDAWPIYHLPGQLVTRYPGGPVFSAPDIAELRIWLADHFKQTGRIRNRKELGILYFSPSDLQVYPPRCTLRAPGIPDIPVFAKRNGTGAELLAPVNSHTVAVSDNGGAAIFDLHRAVGEYLSQRGRLSDLSQVTVRKVTPEQWQQIEATLCLHEQALLHYRRMNGRLERQRIPVYAVGDGRLVAARTNRVGRVVLYVAADIQTLRLRVGEELSGRGDAGGSESLRIVPARPQAHRSALDRLLETPSLLAA